MCYHTKTSLCCDGDKAGKGQLEVVEEGGSSASGGNEVDIEDCPSTNINIWAGSLVVVVGDGNIHEFREEPHVNILR